MRKKGFFSDEGDPGFYFYFQFEFLEGGHGSLEGFVLEKLQHVCSR